MRKKTDKNIKRFFLKRYVLLPVFVFLSIGFIYPGVALLTKWFASNSGDPYAQCVVLPPETVGSLYLAGLLIVVAWACLFRALNSAMLALLYPVPYGMWMATWWFGAASAILLCDRLPGREAILPLVHLCLFSIAAACAIWLHRRLPRTIDFNKQVYDFERMELGSGPVLRPDAATVKSTHVVWIFAFFIAAKFVLDYLLLLRVPKESIGDWEGVILLSALGYLFLLISASGISTAWHVHKRCRGRKMTIGSS